MPWMKDVVLSQQWALFWHSERFVHCICQKIFNCRYFSHCFFPNTKGNCVIIENIPFCSPILTSFFFPALRATLDTVKHDWTSIFWQWASWKYFLSPRGNIWHSIVAYGISPCWGKFRLQIGLRQSFVTQVPIFSKLVCLIYSYRLRQKIKNPGSGLSYNFLKICGGVNFCSLFESTLYYVLGILIPKLDLLLNLIHHQKTNDNVVPEI